MFECDGLPASMIAKATGETKRKRGQRYGHVTYQAGYSYAGKQYPINSSKSGCYTKILQRIIEQITAMRAHYGRVLFIRLDLHHENFGDDNSLVSAFMKSARAIVQSRYQTAHLGYLWARELERAKCQHYHVILLVDGDKVRHPSALLDLLVESWAKQGGVSSIPKNGFIHIDDENSEAKAVHRASYLAKARGKGYRPDGVRDFDCSRIKAEAIRRT